MAPAAHEPADQEAGGRAALEGGAFYDDPDVFSTYMRHRAWSANPHDTIEEPAFLEVLGDVRRERVLDLGCGDARFGRWLLEAGAHSYLGLDASTRMIQLAQQTPAQQTMTFAQQTPQPPQQTIQLPRESSTPAQQAIASAQESIQQTRPFRVRHQRIEEFTAPPASVDIAVSRLALHYVDDIGAVLRRVHDALIPGGRLVFSVEHPVITSSDQAWQGQGPRQAWLVDDYFRTGRRETSWLGARVVKFHRTVEDYVRLIQSHGFQLETLREPGPAPEHVVSQAELTRRQRTPLFLLLSARREVSAQASAR